MLRIGNTFGAGMKTNISGFKALLLTIALLPSQVLAQTIETKTVHSIELDDWYLTLPVDEDDDGKADRINEWELKDGWSDPRFFFPSIDGGLTFRSPVKGAKTSGNTKFVRTELREMLRRGNKSIPTAEPGRNNWVSSTAKRKYRKRAGGVDGELHATLAVNHVTTTGAKNEVGRVIIGQIHGKDDEPVRLYYRKLPHHQRGSLYFAHENKGERDDQYFDLIGSRTSDAIEPENGFKLDEIFSYSIVLSGDLIEVSIVQNEKLKARKRINIGESGYTSSDEYLYFKAGVYNQNKTGNADDYVQATFYDLRNLHSRPR